MIVQRIGMIVLLGAMWGAWQIVQAHRLEPPAQAAQEAPQATAATLASTDRERWAVDFLAALGNASPTADTVAFVVEWTLAEDSGDGAMLRGNPLNTTQPGFSENQTINEDGVKGYGSYGAGLAATVHTIMNGLYDEVVAGLQTNDPQRARAGLFASPWASSHYNYGAGWPNYTIGVR